MPLGWTFRIFTYEDRVGSLPPQDTYFHVYDTTGWLVRRLHYRCKNTHTEGREEVLLRKGLGLDWTDITTHRPNF